MSNTSSGNRVYISLTNPSGACTRTATTNQDNTGSVFAKIMDNTLKKSVQNDENLSGPATGANECNSKEARNVSAFNVASEHQPKTISI